MKLNRNAIDLERARQGITTIKLAEAANMTRQNLYAILARGSCRPETAAKLARALNCDVSIIVKMEG